MIRRNHFKHRLHGQYRWYNGGYKRIGVNLYRKRILLRFWDDRWRHVRSYWKLYHRNKYYKKPRWFWGGYRRVGRNLYRLRTYKRWTGTKWVKIRSYWHLYRRNHYNHRLHGRSQWRWGVYRRIGVHLYRRRKLYRNYQGRWRKVRAYWHLWKRNHYYKPARWSWGRSKRVGRHLCRLRILKRWDGGKWIRIRAYWEL